MKRLGSDYHGVERYRLEQDEARERHWKRWGPYLSDRQWASYLIFFIVQSLVIVSNYFLSQGHSSRGLLV
jgi:hypothetical protein